MRVIAKINFVSDKITMISFVGLGNPGFEYKHTRHNIGFKVLDYFANFYDVKFSSDRYADICEIKYKGKKMYLVKPNTFMNLSGKAVNYWITKLKIPVPVPTSKKLNFLNLPFINIFSRLRITKNVLGCEPEPKAVLEGIIMFIFDVSFLKFEISNFFVEVLKNWFLL